MTPRSNGPPCPKVAILILNWNGWIHTAACVDSLRKISYENHCILLADNDSADQEKDRIRSLSNEKTTVILNKSNFGFAEGNNILIREALKDATVRYVVTLNNDTVVEPDFLEPLVRMAEEHPEIGMVSPTIFKMGSSEIDRIGVMVTRGGLPYNVECSSDVPIFCPSGCCALYSRELLTSVRIGADYYDPDFFCYSEEYDMGFRAQLLGIKAGIAPDSRVHHLGSASTVGHSDFRVYHGHRNTIWCIMKNFPTKLLIQYFHWILLSQVMGLVKRIGKEGFFMVLKAKWHAVLGIPKMLKKRSVVQSRKRISDAELSSIMVSPLRPFLRYEK